jgi:hypothetical protein
MGSDDDVIAPSLRNPCACDAIRKLRYDMRVETKPASSILDLQVVSTDINGQISAPPLNRLASDRTITYIIMRCE